jgi:rieske iron-sulfur protein
VVTPSPDPSGSPDPLAPPPPAPAADAASLEHYFAYREARQQQWLATRRRMLRWVIRIGTGAFSLALLLPAMALRTLTREVKTVAAGDLLVFATGPKAGTAIDTTAIAPGAVVQAFPQGKSDNERNLIELVRLGGDLPAGLVAYSAICTHLGCTVAAALTDRGDIICPCHGSQFDPAHDAAVVHGPANRPLPSLPLQISADGQVVAAGGFSGPVGPV